MQRARAAVLNADGTFSIERFEVPRSLDGAVIEVEACGLCGTDLDVTSGSLPIRTPLIPGHEPVGRILTITENYAQTTGLNVGDRVAVPAELHCGECAGCRADESCLASPGTHGFLPTTLFPGLWGGFAEAMVLSPQTRPLRMNTSVPLQRASLFNLLGAGWSWAVEAPLLRPSQSVVVLGPGQRGLACVLAATSVGANVIAVTGLGSRDQQKLAVALALGAENVLDAETSDIESEILRVAPGGVDVVIDTTPHSTDAVTHAMNLVAPGGTIVIAGLKGAPVPFFSTDTLALRRITLRGVRSVTRSGFRNALTMIESGDERLDLLHTHHFDIEHVQDAIDTLRDDPSAIAVSLGREL